MPSVTVSIGMPVFNGADYIRDALEALLAQSYSDFEIIISDNASTDKTETICREFALRDGRVRYVRNPENIGAAGNYNNVVKLARGEFFKWASHDDLCHPRFLEACVNGFKRAPDDVVLVYPRAEFIDSNGIVIEDDLDTLEARDTRPYVRLYQVISRLNMVNAVFGLFRLSALARTRLIDSFVGSDYVLLAEVAMIGRIWEVPEVYFQRRKHSGMSMLANTSVGARRRWFDPSRKSRLSDAMPGISVTWRLIIEWERSVGRLCNAPAERLISHFVVPPAWLFARLRDWMGMKRRRLRAFIRRPLASEL